jgi:hypothetical protein
MLIRLPGAAAWLALLGAALSGCTGQSRSLCEEQVKAFCAYQYRCCEDDERIEYAAYFGSLAQYVGYENSESECIERNAALACSGAQWTDDSIAAGRQELDRSEMDGCLEDLRAATEDCDIEDFLTVRSRCNNIDVTTPAVDDGDVCALDAECTSGVCTVEYDEDGVPKDVSDEGFAEGECEEAPGEGDECPDYDCAPGLYCDEDGDVPTCREVGGKGDACDYDEQCESNLSCDGDECVEPPDVELEDKFCTGRD